MPHPDGPTCACNLACLCRHHHRLKTLGLWTVINHGDGHLTWRSPHGRTYDVWPDVPIYPQGVYLGPEESMHPSELTRTAVSATLHCLTGCADR